MRGFTSEDVEFALSFSHIGIDITLSVKLNPEVLAGFVDSVEDRNECLLESLKTVFPQVAAQGHLSLQEFHRSLSQALQQSVGKVFRSRVASQ